MLIDGRPRNKMIAVGRRMNADDAKRVTDVETSIIAEEIEDDRVRDLGTDEVTAEAIDKINSRIGDNTKEIHRIV